MAIIVEGVGASHPPTIGFAKDTNKQGDPAWAPIFDGFGQIHDWVQRWRIDAIFMKAALLRTARKLMEGMKCA